MWQSDDRNVEVQNSPAVVTQDNEAEQHPEAYVGTVRSRWQRFLRRGL